MTLQIILSALLAVAAAALIVVPLLRRPKGSARRADYDLQVYKDQLGEVDRDVERGLLTPVQAEAARVEIQRRMLATDASDTDEAAPADTGRAFRVALAVILGLMVPVGALVVYGGLGAPGLPDRPIAGREGERLGIPEAEIARLRQAIPELEKRLNAKPQSQEGWLLLAQAHHQLQDWPQALAAYERAVRLGKVEPTVWSSLGEAHALAADGTVGDAAQAAFRNALRLDRAEPRAQYYLGLARMQAEEPRKAMAVWRALSAASPADAPWMPMLRQRMAMLGQEAGVMPAAVKPVHALDLFDAEQRGETVALEATPGDAEAAAADAQRTAPGLTAEEQAMVDGMVKQLADRLAENPDDFEGWMRLGRSYGVLKRHDAAAEAYGRAAALQPDNVEPRFGQAGALLAQAEAANADRPAPAFFDTVRGILEIEPANPEALYYAGWGAALDGNATEARRLWTQLLDALPADSPQRQDLEKRLQELPAAG